MWTRFKPPFSEHYPDDTPVAIGYRVSWPDQWLNVVPLNQMAAVKERQLIRTTLFVISPALASQGLRSKLYSPEPRPPLPPTSQLREGHRWWSKIFPCGRLAQW